MSRAMGRARASALGPRPAASDFNNLGRRLLQNLPRGVQGARTQAICVGREGRGRPFRWRRSPSAGIDQLLRCVALAGALLLSLASCANAATPNQFVLASHFGLEVNKTEVKAGASQQERNLCAIASGDECQPGANDEAGVAGGFFYAGSVAVNAQGDAYIADTANQRVQELGPDGTFIAMFGWNVNRTEVKAGAPQRERDVCTAASGDECQAGETGSEPGSSPEELGQVNDIAVDQSTGDLYVLTPEYHRIEMLTGTGEFVWMAGEEVNQTEIEAGGSEAQRNLCTAASADTCKAGAEAPAESKAPDAFKVSESNVGNLLAVGGPKDLLYVGDEGRVQEITASGEWEGEIELGGLSSTGRVSAVAVDAAGEVFFGDPAAPGVHEVSPSKQLQPQVIGPVAGPQGPTVVRGLALDAYGRLGILSAEEALPSGLIENTSGVLYSTSGKKISSFAPPSGIGASLSLAFAAAGAPLPDELYLTETEGFRQEVEAYEPVVAPEVGTCLLGGAPGATSAMLCGEFNPNGVSTKGLFLYGSTSALGSRTASAFEGSGTTFVPTSFEVAGLEPNEKYFYAAAAETTVNGRKILATGETLQFTTPSVAQQLQGSPSASFLTPQAAVLTASFNPEHTGTSYNFQYGPCQTLNACSNVLSTPTNESSVYGTVEDVQEIAGLAPATTYSYRLITERAGERPIVGAESSFTTGSAPVLFASTGPASSITATSATISGSVGGGGEPAGYAFEFGVYQGAGTQYGVVFSASTGAGGAKAVSFTVNGLQPGTAYAYRISTRSGYGSATGAAVLFTTSGLPALLIAPQSPAQLPNSVFPPEHKAAKAGRPSTRAQKLAAALRQCRGDHHKKTRRRNCEAHARKRFGARKAAPEKPSKGRR